MECKCQVFDVLYAEHEIVYCPLHEAASDMYKALKALIEYQQEYGGVIPCLADAIKAIAKAEGK